MSGCSGSSSGSLNSDAPPAAEAPKLLAITPMTKTLAIGGSLSLEASGGSEPYTFDIYYGNGSVTSAGVVGTYQAPNSEGAAVVRVQDASGNAGYATVEITDAPVIQPASKTLAVTNKFPFAVLSGKTPYTFSITSGEGTINASTGEFTAGVNAGTVTIRVTDAGLRTSDATVTVNPALSFTTKTIYVEKSATYTLTASGGVAPYSFIMASGAGSVDKTTGVYTAPDSLGSSTVYVFDSLGNVDLAAINITTALSINPSTALIAKNGSLLFSAVGGVPPYTYAVNTGGVGTIVAATGAYTAPTSTGTASVQVTDLLGHTSASTVTITNNLSFSVANLILAVGNTYDISTIVNGGVAPLTYTVPSGQGSFSGANYTAPNTPGVYTITVSDSQAPTPNTITTTVSVNSALTLLPTSAVVAVGMQKSFSGSGGVPPYTYSVQSGSGTINNEGLYTAPTTSGSAVLSVTDARNNTATASVSIQAALAIVPSTKTLSAGESFTFTATGGNLPYSFSLVSGSGAINSNSGLYTAPGSSGLATVRVEDASGNRKEVLITILNPLSISPATISLIKSGAITFTASGGAGPYRFSMASGEGSVVEATGVFTAANAVGTSTVRVTDSLENIKDATITIYDGLTISPFTKNLALNQTFTFTAAGGVAPYTYSLFSGVGSVSSVGVYSSSTAGAAIVQVTDGAGNTSKATVSVSPALAINPTSKNLSVNNQFTFSATGGVPPYSYSVFSGGGTVTSAGGDYKAPSTSTSAVVRVTDADNVTADASVTVSGALTISPTSGTLAAGGTQNFIAAGGVSDYTYSVSSGGGSFTSSTYTAPTTASGANVVILVTDALGNTANAAITINPITVAISSPNSSSVITNTTKASFSVSGACTEAGQAVAISATDGTNTAVTATPTCTSGAWSTSLNLSSLNDTAITITANHSNIHSVAATPASVTLTKDSSAPTITISSPTASSYVSTSVTVTGACTKLGPISITVTGGITAATSCISNSYSKLIDLSSAADGALTITANHTDTAETAATPASVVVTKNSVVPTVAISAPSVNIINSSGTISYTLTYSGASSVSVGTADIVYTGASTGCSASISGSGTVSRTIAITSCSGDGSLQINIAANSAQNNAGAQAAASSLSTAVTVDNTLPVLTGLANDATVHTSKNWSWSCTETNGPCTYRFLVDTSASTPTFAGSYVTTSTASQLTGSGTYYLHVEAKDTAGNISATTNVSTILNNTAATVALSSPSATIMNATSTITYTATYSGAASISLANNDIVFTGISSGCAATVSGTGLTTRTISVTGCIGDGSLQINVAANTAQNDAGAQAAASSLSAAVTVDNTLPVLTGLSNDATSRQTKSWTWACTETNGPCTYRYVVDTNPTYPFIAESFGATTSTSQSTGTNTYYLHVEAKDAAGNISTRTDVSTILDNTAPSAPSSLALNTPATSPGTSTTPIIQINGVVSGDTVKLFSNSNCTSQVASGVSSGTSILLTATSPLTEGTYTFSANSTDPVSNVSSCSTVNVTYQLDLTVATVNTVTASGNGPFTTAGTFTISIQFSKVVNVTGTPVLALTTGQSSQATYSSGTGTNTLLFAYTVASGDNSSDLTYTATNSLTLAGGTIKDNAGNNATLTLPVVGEAGSLSVNQQIVIDTTVPAAPSALVDGTWMASTTVSPTITFTSGTDTGGSGILKHQIQVVLGSDTATVLKTWADFNTSGTAVTDLGLTNAIQYKVQMKAVDNAGNESTVVTSDGWTVDTAAPTVPTGLTLGAVQNTVTTTPTLSWSVSTDSGSGLSHYQAQVYKQSDNTTVGTLTTLTSGSTITGLSLTSGSDYYFKVKAVDTLGNTSSESAASSAWTAVNSTKFVALPNNYHLGSYSTDGVNWTDMTLPVSTTWHGVAFGNGKFVATSSGTNAAYSTSGTAWTSAPLPTGYGGTSVAYGNGKFVALAASTNKAVYSTDGISWSTATLPSSGNWQLVTYGTGRFVAVAYNTTGAAYSTDGGATWTASAMPSAASWSSVVYGNGKFVAVAEGATPSAAYSTDGGATWTATTLPNTTCGHSVTYAAGKFVTVGNGGEGAYSSDGISWTTMTLPSGISWQAVAYGGGKFTIVGWNSTASAYSTDGISWTASAISFAGYWVAAVHD